MASSYYKPCKELDICEKLINDYYKDGLYDKCFEGHLELAKKTRYPLACTQVGYFYMEGIGVKKDLDEAFKWSLIAAEGGDRDGQANLAYLYENGYGCIQNHKKALYWYKKAANQNNDWAISKLEQFKENN